MKGLKSALQAAASAAASTVAATVEAASGPRALREYALLHPDKPEARGGLGGIWSVHLARPKRQGSAAALPLVSVWLIDKRVLLASSSSSSGGGCPSPEEGEAALAAARAGAAALARVKHPNVLRVIEPLEETRHVLALVTEGVWGTAAELLLPGPDGDSARDSSFSSARAREARSVSRLEVLHGLAGVCRALSFLHGRGIVHRALGPSAVVLTRSGGWKLAGMDLSVPESDPACQRAGGSFFDFGVSGGRGGGTSASFRPFDVAAASRPELPYASPELVEASSPLTTATDVFSLGALAASLLSARRAPLFPPAADGGGPSPRAHLAAVRALASSPGGLSSAGLPNGGCGGDPAAAAGLAPLLAPEPSARPSADDVERLPLFAADEALRALRALEVMSLPSAAAAAAALAAGSGGEVETDAGGGKLRVLSRVGVLLPSLDARVRELLVLPPLLLEARAAARAGGGDGETLAVCLSIILDIAMTQGKAEFEASTLPALRAVCANMVSTPSPKRKQQQQQQVAAAAAAASEGGAATAAAGPPPPPPPPPMTTAIATPAALVLLERAPFLAQRCPPDLLLPLVCRALDAASEGSSALSSSSSAASAAAAVARAQELSAAASPSVGASAGPQVSEAQLLPRLHRLALATTAARVRAACFRALGEICAGGGGAEGGGAGGNALPSSASFQQQRRAPEPLPREAAVKALASFARAAAVDGSASTADAGVALATSLASRWGTSLAAQAVIPALAPLLAHGDEVLPDDAFGRVAEAIRGHVAAIEAERARRRSGGRGGGGERGGGITATARLPTKPAAAAAAAAAPGAAAASASASAFAAPSAALRTQQATLHRLFAASAPATTRAPPPAPAVLLPPPPRPPASSSVAANDKRSLFFPPPPAASSAASAAAAAPSADRVPSLGLSSDLFGEWSVAEETGGSGGGESGSGSGDGERAPTAAGAPLAGGGGGDDAAFDALFADAATSARQRQEQQQQQRQQQNVIGSARGAPMRPRPPPAAAPPLANGGGSGSDSLI